MLRVVTLGTSAAVPTPTRGLPAILIQYGHTNILLDCGEGTQLALMKGHFGMHNIEVIGITHWHADHFSGLTGLTQTMGLDNREQSLTIGGPEGTEKAIQKLFSVGYGKVTYPIKTEDWQAGQMVFERSGRLNFSLKTFATDHVVPSLGYIFEEGATWKVNKQKMEKLGLEASPLIGKLKKGDSVSVDGRTIHPEDILERVPGRKILYTGDTTYSEHVIQAARGADMLIHDATFSEETKRDEYGHASAREAALVAREAGVKQLVLVHIGRRYTKNVEPLEREARQIFKNTNVAADAAVYTISIHRPEQE